MPAPTARSCSSAPRCSSPATTTAQAAERNLNFVLRSQQADGSWYYAADGVRDFVDHFHTCFVLKALAKIERGWSVTHGCRQAIDAGVGLLRASAVRRRRPAQAILERTTTDHLPARTVRLCRMHQLATLLRGRFRCSTNGSSRRWPICSAVGRSRTDRSARGGCSLGWDNVPMHRWAQSQMFRSLCFPDCGAAAARTNATLGNAPHRSRRGDAAAMRCPLGR